MYTNNFFSLGNMEDTNCAVIVRCEWERGKVKTENENTTRTQKIASLLYIISPLNFRRSHLRTVVPASFLSPTASQLERPLCRRVRCNFLSRNLTYPPPPFHSPHAPSASIVRWYYIVAPSLQMRSPHAIHPALD